jgi:hypothetical protein
VFSRYTVVLDSCVLYPAQLRDTLITVAGTGLYRARWTRAIHDEWIAAVLRDRPDLSRERLERTRELMDRAVLDCLVTGYEPLIPSLQLPDESDRHVLAAAIRANAGAIVTFNLRDFPAGKLEPYGIEALHPDEFMLAQVDLNADAVLKAMGQQRGSLVKPSLTPEQFLAKLGGLLPRFAAYLGKNLDRF